MKFIKLNLFLLTLLAWSCSPKTGADMKTATEAAENITTINTNSSMDSLSYSVGVLVAQNLKQQGLDKVNADDLATAIKDVIESNDLKIDIQTANQNVQTHMQAAKAKAEAANIEIGKAFLAENATKEGVKVTDSGLQYKVLEEGAGKMPKASDSVTVHYEGTLISGEVFDSSYKRGEPTSFPLNGVIKGWTEGLQLMKEGAKYRFFIPSELAYGPRSAGPTIGPNSTLIFDVELISIK